MSIRDAGDAIAYLPNLSQDLGQLDVADAKQKIEANSLNSALNNLLVATATSYQIVRCGVGLVLDQLSDDDRELLRRLIDEARQDGTMIPATMIAGVLQHYGFTVKPLAVRRHRRRKIANADCCACE